MADQIKKDDRPTSRSPAGPQTAGQTTKVHRDYGLLNIEWTTISIRSINLVVFSLAALIVAFLVWFYFITGHRLSVQPDTDKEVAAGPAARFLYSGGKVEVKTRDGFVWQEASFQTELHTGDRVRTAADSSAKIRFVDGTEITVQPDTIVEIKETANRLSEQQSTFLIQEGSGSVDARQSETGSKVLTNKLDVRLNKGARGDITTQKTGNDIVVLSQGEGVVSTRSGRTIALNQLDELVVNPENRVKKEKLPTVPVPYSPQSGAVITFLNERGLTLELKWRDVLEAVKYEVQISDTPLFEKLIAHRKEIVKNSVRVDIRKTPRKQYFWRVRSIDKNERISLWSEASQFLVKSEEKALPPVPDTRPGPPPLKITWIYPFFPYVQVEGTTEPDAFLTLNGEIIDIREDGKFSYTYRLTQPGVNMLTFIAEDPAGNKTRLEKSVRIQ